MRIVEEPQLQTLQDVSLESFGPQNAWMTERWSLFGRQNCIPRESRSKIGARNP